jgi:hypothetical protein
MIRSHLPGILAWTKTRVSKWSCRDMDNKINSISHRAFGLRSADSFIATIYQCCARLSLPAEH